MKIHTEFNYIMTIRKYILGKLYLQYSHTAEKEILCL